MWNVKLVVVGLWGEGKLAIGSSSGTPNHHPVVVIKALNLSKVVVRQRLDQARGTIIIYYALNVADFGSGHENLN